MAMISLSLSLSIEASSSTAKPFTRKVEVLRHALTRQVGSTQSILRRRQAGVSRLLRKACRSLGVLAGDAPTDSVGDAEKVQGLGVALLGRQAHPTHRGLVVARDALAAPQRLGQPHLPRRVARLVHAHTAAAAARMPAAARPRRTSGRGAPAESLDYHT